MDLNFIGKNAKNASEQLAQLNFKEKNNILKKCAENILLNKESIILANQKDVLNAKENNLESVLIERLTLNDQNINNMCNGVGKIIEQKDSIGEYISVQTLDNGLKVFKKRVPIGVIGIIYESRPNVTLDSFAICLKASSVVILKGGKEAINTNREIVKILRKSISDLGYNQNFVQLIDTTDRQVTYNMMKLREYINVLIPRGGKSLIKAVIENSSIPVIETGVGNCHIFVDESTSVEKALKIILNAKVQRPYVCNALESLLIHKNIAKELLPPLIDALIKNNVEIRADKKIIEMFADKNINVACEQDWKEEFLDYILAIKIVDNIDEAITHISKYSTGHSEAIITENYTNANMFTEKIDSAVVYVNSSTRFTDGGEFELGAEIGISTQKLHSRGPMGVKEITSYKYIVLGDGQIRED